jgi:Xaa-Pro aminopeptidase
MTNPLQVSSTGASRAELTDEVSGRRERLAEAMQRRGIEALVVASEANASYLSGYETTFWGNRSKPFAVVFMPPERPCVVCHVGEAVSVELDAIDVDIHPYAGPQQLWRASG